MKSFSLAHTGKHNETDYACTVYCVVLATKCFNTGDSCVTDTVQSSDKFIICLRKKGGNEMQV